MVRPSTAIPVRNVEHGTADFVVANPTRAFNIASAACSATTTGDSAVTTGAAAATDAATVAAACWWLLTSFCVSSCASTTA